MVTDKKVLLISILSLGRPQNISRFLTDMPSWLNQIAANLEIMVHFVVRNNDPSVGFEDICNQFDVLNESHSLVHYTLITGGPNLGFGGGHNENFRRFASNYLLILNDDIGFPHLNWLPEALGILNDDNQIACVGASENPQYLDPTFGNGLENFHFGLENLKYAEGSIALFNSKIFSRLGMFNNQIEWAMCEDADLSLRAQQHGYRLHWIPIPHQHWRSTTFNTLPAEVKSSILEHNRATIFALWGQTLATGCIGETELYDIWSEGMGDVFCALPHLLSYLDSLTPDQRARVTVNLPYPELIDLLKIDDIKTTSIASQQELQLKLGKNHISTVHSIRDVNYALPLNIHAVLCGALSIPLCNLHGFAKFRSTLMQNATNKATWKQPIHGQYCVINLEFHRSHEGRGLAISRAQEILQECCNTFETVVVVGKEKRFSDLYHAGQQSNLLDLQSRLSIPDLISIIGGASYFVGIDSFPGHVAQALGVKAAIFFGAVHPLARLWNEQRVWPIVADLPCIGCYHTHIEPSPTFCMRRDEACTINLDIKRVGDVLRCMVANKAHSWSGQRLRLQQLQSKWIGLMRHHPAPPDRLVRSRSSGNLLVSNTIYRVLDQLSELTSIHYPQAIIETLNKRIAELEAEIGNQPSQSKRASDEDILRVSTQQEPSKTKWCREKIIDLVSLQIKTVECRLVRGSEWIEVHSSGLDPQLFLPNISNGTFRVDLTLEVLNDRNDYLQIFWSKDKSEYSEDRQHYVPTSPKPTKFDISFQLQPDEVLALRIDPASSPGVTRLRGTVKQVFAVMPTNNVIKRDQSASNYKNVNRDERKVRRRSAKTAPAPSASL